MDSPTRTPTPAQPVFLPRGLVYPWQSLTPPRVDRVWYLLRARINHVTQSHTTIIKQVLINKHASGSGAMSGTKLMPNRVLVNTRLGNHQS